MVKTSTAERHGYRCPECGDELSRDKSGRGHVRHRSNPDCRFEEGERDSVPSGTTSVATHSVAALAAPPTPLSPAASERIRAIIEESVNSKPVMPPTEIFNEGWLLRLALDWFASHPDVQHRMAVPSGCRWYSEALLASQFAPRFRGDPLCESHTHADGVVGHFRIGGTGRGDLALDSDARHFVVLEAKVGSRLSAGTTKALGFDQAARNVACMVHAMSSAGASIDGVERLGFYVVAPQSQIIAGTFDRELTLDGIRDKVLKRVRSYDEPGRLTWYENWFLPALDRLDVDTVSWEDVIATMMAVDAESAAWFGDFYDSCLHFNRVSA